MTTYNAYFGAGVFSPIGQATITPGTGTPVDLTHGASFIATFYNVPLTLTYGGTFTDGSVTGFYATFGSVTEYFVLPPATLSGFTNGLSTTTGGWNLNTNMPDTCFLRGTRIATAAGEALVEDLRPGDLIATLINGKTAHKPIVWIGHRHVTRAKDAPDDAYPVRIRAGAFGENLPRRDLLVTAEHCLLADGHLIPARMLVNGGSITVAREISDYTYYHVELERHGILLAEGVPTESYLDTGNRAKFANAEIASLRPDFALNAAHGRWDQDAAAPLAVDRATVEPIWRRLRDRAVMRGMLPAISHNALTNEPDLRLVTDTGVDIHPAMVDGAIYAFAVPAGVGAVHLRSRTARPVDVVGPFLDDRRELGVAVGRISLWAGRRQAVTIESHLTAALSGWHAPEASGTARWTSGNAELPLDMALPKDQPFLLRIEIVQAGPYLARAYMPDAIAA